jgi:hypothetical protein
MNARVKRLDPSKGIGNIECAAAGTYLHSNVSVERDGVNANE